MKHLALLLALTAPASAQAHLIYRLDGTVGGGPGFEVGTADDVDGDGVPDIIVGSPAASPGGLSQAGRCDVFSGYTGLLLFSWPGRAAGDRLGWRVAAAGDVDRDGFGDVMASATGSGQAYVVLLSGRTGTPLKVLTGPAPGPFGSSLFGLGDVDGDTVPDLAIGETTTGSVAIYSGATFGVLRTLSRPWGVTASGLNDIDGDGVSDLLLFGTPSSQPRADVFSSRTGALIRTVPFAVLLASLVASVGDIDGDGRDDVVVGNQIDRVAVYSTGTGLRLFDLPPPQRCRLPSGSSSHGSATSTATEPATSVSPAPSTTRSADRLFARRSTSTQAARANASGRSRPPTRARPGSSSASAWPASATSTATVPPTSRSEADRRPGSRSCPSRLCPCPPRPTRSR